jgi:hypothetical protein
LRAFTLNGSDVEEQPTPSKEEAALDRKHFLGTLFILPFGIFLVHCSSDGDTKSSSSDPNAPAAPPTQSGGMDVYTSSTVSQHSHTFSLDDTAISAPPAAGVNGDSSVSGGHSHTVAISADQLQQVSTGSSVQVTTGDAGGHTHVFTFVKIA